MSLLLDALKKAEEAKRRKQAEQAGTTLPEVAAGTKDATTDTPAPDDFPSLALADTPSSTPPAAMPEAAVPAAATPAATPQPDANLPALDFALEAPAPVAKPAPAAIASDVATAAERLAGRSGKASAEGLSLTPATSHKPAPRVEPVLHEPAPTPDVVPTPADTVKVATLTMEPSPSAPARSAATASDRAPSPGPAKLNPAAAKQLFDAKKRPAKPALSPKQRAVYLGGLVLACAGLAGGWLWWQTRQPATTLAVANPPAQAEPPVAGPAAPAAPTAATAATAVTAATDVPAAPTAMTPAASEPPAVSGNAAPPKAVPMAAPEDTARLAPPRPPVAPKPGDRAKVIEVPENVAANDVRFLRNNAATSVPAAIASAYQSFEQGDYAGALSQYKRYLASDPKSRDALLGIGASSVRLGLIDDARQAYRAALAIDPKDGVASAALASLAPDREAEGSEGKLRQLYDAQPSPSTASALGSLLARQGRWREAQDYYFRAYTAAPGEPDHAFNLAVSLDALSERALAAEYYGKALGLPGGSFDREAAKRRLAALGRP